MNSVKAFQQTSSIRCKVLPLMHYMGSG